MASDSEMAGGSPTGMSIHDFFSDDDEVAPSESLDQRISRELGDLIDDSSSTLACGGTISIEDPSKTIQSEESTSKPITLRWDDVTDEAPSGIAKLKFPMDDSIEADRQSLDNLIKKCQSASIGEKDKQVFAESNRNVTKLHRSAFSVDFCPYELGIIDTIAQVLLPNAVPRPLTHGIKAELCELNIYSAQSAYFKAEVDTHRPSTQFASLVVLLPCHHEDGELVVRPGWRHSVVHDLGELALGAAYNDSVKWAAFYSDCKHEILRVTKGHRITLVYHLHLARGVGDLATSCSIFDAESLPLFDKVKAALSNPEFMKTGGRLGVYFHHKYPHSTVEGYGSLSNSLKGSDMAVYSVFNALDLDPRVRAILDYGDCPEEDISGDDFEGETFDDVFKKTCVGSIFATRVSMNTQAKTPKALARAWGGKLKDVNWLNDPSRKNRILGMVKLAQGDRGVTNKVYHAYLALVVKIPPASRRTGLGSKTKQISSE